MLALLSEQRLLADHRQLRTGAEVHPGPNDGSKLDKLEALIVPLAGRGRRGFVAAILSIPCEQRYRLLAITPQKHKDETLRTLVDLTEAAARRQPSVMLFEDAHWADPTHSEVLGSADRPGQNRPAAGRAHLTGRSFSRAGPTRHVSGPEPIPKLTPAQSTAMVSALAGMPQRCRRAARGRS